MNHKMPIEWHKECLSNTKIFLRSKEIELARMKADIERTATQLCAYQDQISEADSRGVLAFDAEKFGKKRSAK